MATNSEELTDRLASDARITTPTLWRILKDIDAQMDELTRAGETVPSAIRQVREVVARAYLKRLDHERAPPVEEKPPPSG